MNAPPVYGLVLAGGRSSRMRRDKAAIEFRDGVSQLDAAMKLLSDRVVRAFISVRSDQVADPARAHHERIVDRGDVEGPIAGICAAFEAHPDVAWLVLACDLPFLDGATLDTLLASRAIDEWATAFRSAHDGLPEPLCAIYEPRARAALAEHIAAGRNCPRKFLTRAQTLLLDQPNPHALDNVNTVEEYERAMSSLNEAGSQEHGAVKNIRVQYFALLREQAGRSEETLSTGARDARELYAELRQRYPFTLPAEMLRVAINAEFAEWSQPLEAGDAIVFIPPVAGG